MKKEASWAANIFLIFIFILFLIAAAIIINGDPSQCAKCCEALGR